MIFDYDLYFRGCLIVPCSIILFVVIVLVIALIPFIKKIISRSIKSNDVIKLIIFLVVGAILTIGNIKLLSSGGFHLLNEREYDAIVLEGEIQQITEIGHYSFPNFRSTFDEESKGYNLIINGIECTMPIKDNYNVGDIVKITYLPKSGYILSIEKYN